MGFAWDGQHASFFALCETEEGRGRAKLLDTDGVLDGGVRVDKVHPFHRRLDSSGFSAFMEQSGPAL